MPTTRIIVLFNLKPGKSKADYEAWAKATDLPVVNALASVSDFSVFETTGLLGGKGAAPYQYVEIIDVADMAKFGDEVGTAAMQQVAAEFAGWANPVFFTTRNIVDPV